MFSSSPRRGLLRVACGAVALGAVGVAGTAADAGVIVVDDFSDTTESWPASLGAIGNAAYSEFGLTGVVGGSRYTAFGADSLAVPSVDTISVAVAPSAGLFEYASSSGADGNFSLMYDGPGGDLNADLSSLSAFGIEIVLFDFGNSVPMPVTVTLDDGFNVASRTEIVSVDGAQTLSMQFADFTGIGSLDLSSINSILIEFDPGLGNDLRLGAVTVVPAPAGLALLGTFGLIGARRRRR